jgi:hypothetical protein
VDKPLVATPVEKEAPVAPAVEPAPLPGGVVHLTDAQRDVFWGSPEDEVPDSRRDNRHYAHTNEKKHHLFFEHMDCSDGGAYLGVGSDQNYTMLAHCKASYAWILDYDEVVVMLHRIHRALILESETTAEFLARWEDGAQQQTLEVIRKHEGDSPDIAYMEELFGKYRKKLREHFERLDQRKLKGEAATWLSNDEYYRYVRGMFMAGRIRPMLGNLLADRAVSGIGKAATELGVPVRVIYLTNVEELVQYNDAFRESFRSLPVDEKSVVLRTLAYTNGYEIADNKWHYNIQSALGFQERMGTKISRIQVFMHARKEKAIKGVSTLDM